MYRSFEKISHNMAVMLAIHVFFKIFLGIVDFIFIKKLRMPWRDMGSCDRLPHPYQK